jgi:hypothetical protein
MVDSVLRPRQCFPAVLLMKARAGVWQAERRTLGLWYKAGSRQCPSPPKNSVNSFIFLLTHILNCIDNQGKSIISKVSHKNEDGVLEGGPSCRNQGDADAGMLMQGTPRFLARNHTLLIIDFPCLLIQYFNFH